MSKVDYTIKDLEERLKDDLAGMESLNELVSFIGDLETEISRLQAESNSRSWDGYVDRQSGAFDATEVAEFHRRDWT